MREREKEREEGRKTHIDCCRDDSLTAAAYHGEIEAAIYRSASTISTTTLFTTTTTTTTTIIIINLNLIFHIQSCLRVPYEYSFHSFLSFFFFKYSKLPEDC